MFSGLLDCPELKHFYFVLNLFCGVIAENALGLGTKTKITKHKQRHKITMNIKLNYKTTMVL